MDPLVKIKRYCMSSYLQKSHSNDDTAMEKIEAIRRESDQFYSD